MTITHDPDGPPRPTDTDPGAEPEVRGDDLTVVTDDEDAVPPGASSTTSWPGASRRVGGRYILEEPIGSGGASVVWRAYDDVLDRSVAVKILHPHLAVNDTTVERFHREAQAAARLAHPNVVPIYDVGTDGDIVYLVMELIDGSSLAEIMRDAGPMDPVIVAALGEQVAAALGEAHDAGLVHRDVKPANILLNGDGVAKLTDFGIVKAIGEEAAKLTNPGTVVGTAAYIAPEQLQQDVVIDARADVYSLGVLLYECLTGRPAYQGDTPTATAAARLHQDLPSPRQLRADVPRGLDEVLVRATRRERDDRHRDGAGLANALAPLVPARPSDVTAALLVPRGAGDDVTDQLPAFGAARTEPGRWPVLVIGAILLVVIAVLATQALDRGDAGGDGRGGAQPAQSLPIESARDFDPFGTDREESPDEVAFVHDGDLSTAWTTERYRTAPRFGNLKPGVGVWFDLGTSREVTSVQVDVATPGITVQLHAVEQFRDAEAAGLDAFAAWGDAVLEPVRLEQVGSFELPGGAVSARYWLVWITELAPTGDGRYEAAIAEVRFLGP